MTKKTRGNVVVLQIEEILVWSKLARGEYNRNQAYSHVKLVPQEPWLIAVPVEGMESAEAVGEALASLHQVVQEVTKQQVEQLAHQERESVREATAKALVRSQEGGVGYRTGIKNVSRTGQRPSIESAVDGEPVEDDF